MVALYLIGLTVLIVLYTVGIAFVMHWLLVNYYHRGSRRNINILSVGIPSVFYAVSAGVMFPYLAWWVIAFNLGIVVITSIGVFTYFHLHDKKEEEY